VKSYFPMRNFVLAFLILAGASVKSLYAQEAGRDKNEDLNDGGTEAINLNLFENDGGLATINSVPGYQCSGTITPSVEIVNYGSNVLTSAFLEYYIDSDAPQTF